MDGWTQRRDRQAGEQEGEHVRAQARDLIARLEGVAGRVWEEARDGSLPPFRELGPAGDSFSSATTVRSSRTTAASHLRASSVSVHETRPNQLRFSPSTVR